MDEKEIREAVGTKLNVDHIVFLCANGCSVYAGTKAINELANPFPISEIKNEEIKKYVDGHKNGDFEQFLNGLLAAKSYFEAINDEASKNEAVSLIDFYKNQFLNNCVAGLDYSKLEFHEQLLMKLRSLNCLQKTSIFTTNYDVAFEYCLDSLNIPYADGFSGFINRRFDPRSLDIQNSLEVIKLHGSLNWRFQDDYTIQELQPEFDDAHRIKASSFEKALIYPTSQKYEDTFSLPYSELFRKFLNRLSSESNLVFVLGYKYGDEHVNNVLLKSLANPLNFYYFFDYDKDEKNPFLKNMKRLEETSANIKLIQGNDVASFQVFVSNYLPSTPQKTDEEIMVENLKKVLKK